MSLYETAFAIEAEARALTEAGDAGVLSIMEMPRLEALPLSSAPVAAAAPLQRLWKALQQLGGMPLLQGRSKRLRVSETVSLGEKRFVSIVEVDGVSLLIGGGSGHVSLLTQLGDKPPSPSFQGALAHAWRAKEPA